MKITQFKKMLALHGADITRWDGADIDAVRELIRTSAEARALYNDAAALDDALDGFTAPPADPAILARVMGRIGGAEDVPPLIEQPAPAAARPPPGWNMEVFWAGAVVCAVALLVFIGSLGSPAEDGAGAIQTAMMHTPPEQAAPAAAPEAEQLLAALDMAVEEEIVRQEMIGLLAMAETAAPEPSGPQPAPQGEDIDAFLDRLFSDIEDEPPAADDMELWKLFLESQTREL